jgi:hypothetical protein
LTQQRNALEWAIGKLRQHAVTAGFDKRDYIWRGTIDVALTRT